MNNDDGERGEDRVRIRARRTLYQGFSRYVEYDVDERRADGGVRTMSREFQTRGDVVAVLPYDPIRKIAVLARQLRVPVLATGRHDGYVLEAPAGYIDDGEDPSAAARREASEEVGLSLNALEFVGRVYSSPGAMTERLTLFLARFDDSDRVSDGGGLDQEDEEIEVVEIALSALADACDAGQVDDAKTMLLIQTLRLRKPALFS